MAEELKKSTWSKLWTTPKSRWLLGIPLGAVLTFGLGAIALGTTNYALHKTSATEFCYACHSHEQFIKPEYEASTHFANAVGVRAECADCHLPHGWFDLVTTKMIVSLDIIPEMQGKISTAEKYEEHRAELAEEVWHQFMENDSQFCRHCHSFEAMNFEQQDRRVSRQHERASESGRTCIECHYGIVHREPENATALMEAIVAEHAGEDAAGD